MDVSEGPSTRSVHLANPVDPITRAIVPPIVENAAYAFNDLDTWREVALGERSGDIYSRNSNPTTRLLEEKVAALEGAESATSFATGMAAINTTLFALLNPSQRAVTVRDAYGATFLHFTQILPRFNIACQVCETDDHEAIEKAIQGGCDLLYLESPTNPTLKVLDLARLIEAAHQVGAIVIVDNTFATPINQNPVALGADLVIHSATKFLGGHGDVLGGLVCGREELVERVYRYRELTGPSLDAFSAYLLLRSLKTLGLRVQRRSCLLPGSEEQSGARDCQTANGGFWRCAEFRTQRGLGGRRSFSASPALRLYGRQSRPGGDHRGSLGADKPRRTKRRGTSCLGCAGRSDTLCGRHRGR
jgi:cystathionine gamma-synthase